MTITLFVLSKFLIIMFTTSIWWWCRWGESSTGASYYGLLLRFIITLNVNVVTNIAVAFDNEGCASRPSLFPTNNVDRLANEYWNEIVPWYDTYSGGFKALFPILLASILYRDHSGKFRYRKDISILSHGVRWFSVATPSPPPRPNCCQ